MTTSLIKMTAIISLLVALIAGCSSKGPQSVTSQDKKYLAAKSIPPLKMPPGISSSKFKNRYPVSDRQYPAGEIEANLVPPGLYNN